MKFILSVFRKTRQKTNVRKQIKYISMGLTMHKINSLTHTYTLFKRSLETKQDITEQIQRIIF